MTTWTASDVLDAYADLIRRLRRPSAHVANFTAFHMNRALHQDHKRTQFYPVMPAAGWSVTDRAAVCGTEVSYIPAYVKGPEGARIITRRKLNRLSRLGRCSVTMPGKHTSTPEAAHA